MDTDTWATRIAVKALLEMLAATGKIDRSRWNAVMGMSAADISAMGEAGGDLAAVAESLGFFAFSRPTPAPVLRLINGGKEG